MSDQQKMLVSGRMCGRKIIRFVSVRRTIKVHEQLDLHSFDTSLIYPYAILYAGGLYLDIFSNLFCSTGSCMDGLALLWSWWSGTRRRKDPLFQGVGVKCSLIF